MSCLMQRAALLSQGSGAGAPPVDTDAPWQLDASRRPAGLSLSDGNQTAINTTGGSNYLRWVPTARAILPVDGKRYWEVLCAPSGAATFDGYIGVVSAEQREDYNSGDNPITLGSIAWRGNGSLWSSNSGNAVQQLTSLPPFGAGDVLMFALDPATASLWIGKNGIWHSDPVSSAPIWSAASSSSGFYPQIQGRNTGDGGTLRSLSSQHSYPAPPGVKPLGYQDPDLTYLAAAAFLEIGWDPDLSIAGTSLWLSQGGGPGCTQIQATLYIEVELP